MSGTRTTFDSITDAIDRHDLTLAQLGVGS